MSVILAMTGPRPGEPVGFCLHSYRRFNQGRQVFLRVMVCFVRRWDCWVSIKPNLLKQLSPSGFLRRAVGDSKLFYSSPATSLHYSEFLLLMLLPLIMLSFFFLSSFIVFLMISHSFSLVHFVPYYFIYHKSYYNSSSNSISITSVLSVLPLFCMPVLLPQFPFLSPSQ